MSGNENSGLKLLKYDDHLEAEVQLRKQHMGAAKSETIDTNTSFSLCHRRHARST